MKKSDKEYVFTDMKEGSVETKDPKPKGRGSGSSNYMNTYYKKSGLSKENKVHLPLNSNIKYENLKHK